MGYSIVQENLSLTQAPAPITYQATGAIVSQGATTLGAGIVSPLISQKTDLTSLLAVPLALSSLAWSSGTVLATAAANIQGRNTGDVFTTTIAGASPAAYNGLVRVTVTGVNTFTYALASNPGSETSPGTYTPAGQGELVAQINTFFSQGNQQGVYVLELGAGDQTTGPAALATWDQANPDEFYSYLIPKGWDASAGLAALLAQYEALNAQKYFFITSKVSTWTAYLATQKCGYVLIEAPTTPLTEFSCAASFQRALAYAPSTSNRMTQFAYAFLFGVTSYPTKGNNALLTQLQAANINVIGTGAEGGISTAVNWWGKMLDGNDFSVWYEIDWMQLNGDQAVAAEVISRANNPQNPLYYNQTGINDLQNVLIGKVQDAITFGLANGTPARAGLDGPAFSQALSDGDFPNQDVVNAVPFITYIAENPDNYKPGIYGGLSLVFIPQKGFGKVIININVNFNAATA